MCGELDIFFVSISPMKGVTNVLIQLLRLQKWLFFIFLFRHNPFSTSLWKYAEHLTHMILVITYLSLRCPLTTGRSSYQKLWQPGYGLRGERWLLLLIWFNSLTAISTEGQTTTCFKSTTQIIIIIVCLWLHFRDSAKINLIFPNVYILRLVIWKESFTKW